MNRVKSKLSDPVDPVTQSKPDPVVTRNFSEYCDPVDPDPVQAWYKYSYSNLLYY